MSFEISCGVLCVILIYYGFHFRSLNKPKIEESEVYQFSENYQAYSYLETAELKPEIIDDFPAIIKPKIKSSVPQGAGTWAHSHGIFFDGGVNKTIELKDVPLSTKKVEDKHKRCISGGTWLKSDHIETEDDKCYMCNPDNEKYFAQILYIVCNPYSYPNGQYRRLISELHDLIGIEKD